MKYILLTFLSLPVCSNTFKLLDTGSRFSLIIDKERLRYQSETLRQSVTIKKCNETIIQNLNAEMITNLPSHDSANGLRLNVDKSSVLVSPSSALGKIILMMDTRMIRLLSEEKSACKS
jgi:hypothetical protein